MMVEDRNQIEMPTYVINQQQLSNANEKLPPINSLPDEFRGEEQEGGNLDDSQRAPVEEDHHEGGDSQEDS